MERNDDNLGNLGSSTNAGENGVGSSGLGNSGDLTGAAGYGASGGSYGTAGGAASGAAADAGINYGAGSSGAAADLGGTASSSEGMKDRARTVANSAGERLSGAGAALRSGAGTAKNSLADMLEAGAKRLGGEGQSQQFAGAAATGSVAMDDSNRLSAVAGGLQTSADWLREADLDGMRQGIENQVRTNPGRSLLIAAGVGYLLGKALRK